MSKTEINPDWRPRVGSNEEFVSETHQKLAQEHSRLWKRLGITEWEVSLIPLPPDQAHLHLVPLLHLILDRAEEGRLLPIEP